MSVELGHQGRPVYVKRFRTDRALEDHLNMLALTYGNRWDIKFLTENKYGFTAVICWVPEDQT